MKTLPANAELWRGQIRLALAPLGALLFNALFWGEQFGINLLLFSAFWSAAIWIGSPPETRKSWPAMAAFAGFWLSAVFVALHHSFPAMFAFWVSYFCLIGFAHQTAIRQTGYAAGAALESYFAAGKGLIDDLKQYAPKMPHQNRAYYYARLALAPVLILTVFVVLFLNGNDAFADLVTKCWTQLSDWALYLLGQWDFRRVWLLIVGFILVAGALYAAPKSYFAERDALGLEHVFRRPRPTTLHTKGKNYPPPFAFNALKSEYLIALITVGLVNLLLVVVNLIDIRRLWFGFAAPPNFNLSQFVHEGTYILIASILLSMAVMLYFFRQNLHFYARNEGLKRLCYVWIVQNLVLLISVALRNYYYIEAHGLAYKRIGVAFFLLLVAAGLVTLWLKIRDKRSAFFLVKSNSWALYAVVVALGAVNWDLLIVRHNLKYPDPKGVDYGFLLTLSDKVLPVLDENRNRIESGYDPKTNWIYAIEGSPAEYIDRRIENYRREQAGYSWLSYTLADRRALDYFDQKYPAKVAKP